MCVSSVQGHGREGSVASELQGKAQLDYDPAGLTCTMEIPLDSVMPDVDGLALATGIRQGHAG